MAIDANETNPRWVTARQVAERYSVTIPTVFNWLRDGIIPAKVAVGRVYRFDPEEVDAALERHSGSQSQHAEEPSLPPCGSAVRVLPEFNPETEA